MMDFGLGWVWIFPAVATTLMALFGWAVLTRVFRTEHHTSPETPTLVETPDPLAIARERYAQGLISKEEFDQLAQDLIRTEKPHL